jgi:ABC-type uncharacterized transport system permease subunit
VEAEKIGTFVVEFSLCLSTPISSFNCVPTGKAFLFSMNRMSEASVLCKIDITYNCTDFEVNTFEIAMSTVFLKSKQRWNRRNT